MRVGGALLAALSVVVGYRPQRDVHEPRSSRADRFWSELALQDWIAFGYLLILLACSITGEGPRRVAAIVYVGVDLGVYFGGLVLVRGGFVTGALAALVYRVGLFVAIFGSFSHLHYVLPTARWGVVDAQLYAFDRTLLGFEPSELFDRWVTPTTTEWFAFFYFGYFFILAAHIVPFMLSRRLALVAEASLGIVILFAVGHLMYVAVPAYGPYAHLANGFHNELDGRFWWPLVKSTVESVDESTRTDIFPSLHTAAPTYLALFSIRHRRETPFRFTWLPLSLFTSQIILSTMFLRWHYIVDVVVGFALAAMVSSLAHRLALREAAGRLAAGKSPVWTALGGPARPAVLGAPVVKT